MRKIMKRADALLTINKPFVLISIIAESGSSPRGAGAKMLVAEDESIVGTIGGGAVEYRAMQVAKEIFTTKHSYEHKFILTKNQVEDLGMICGGDVTVYFHYITANVENKNFFQAVNAFFDEDTYAWIATEIVEETEPKLSLLYQNDLKNIVVASGDLNLSSYPLQSLTKEKPTLFQNEVSKCYIEPLKHYGTVYLFGGGHVSQALAPVLTHLSFPYVVVDDQEKFANRELFSDAKECVLAPFDTVFNQLKITQNDYIVIMTRGHAYDFQVLVQAMRTDAYYIGVIGSKKKIAVTHRRLKEEYGFTDEEIKRIIAPIGLAIGADTPEEISISVAAELIQYRMRYQL